MKSYNKLLVAILATLAITIITGCSSVANDQNSTFDDGSKIIEQDED